MHNLNFGYLLITILLVLEINAKSKPFEIQTLNGATVKGELELAETKNRNKIDNKIAKSGFFDLFDDIFDYFLYDDSEEWEDDETYLICRNCTVVVQPQQPPVAITPPPVITPATPSATTPTTSSATTPTTSSTTTPTTSTATTPTTASDTTPTTPSTPADAGP